MQMAAGRNRKLGTLAFCLPALTIVITAIWRRSRHHNFVSNGCLNFNQLVDGERPMSSMAPTFLKNTAKFTHKALAQIAVSIIATLCTTLLIQAIDLSHKGGAAMAPAPVIPSQLAEHPYSFVSATMPEFIPASGLGTLQLIEAGPSSLPILAAETRPPRPKPRPVLARIPSQQKVLANSQLRSSVSQAPAPVAVEASDNGTAALPAVNQAPGPWDGRWLDLLSAWNSPARDALVNSVTSLGTSLIGVFRDPRG